MPKSSFGEQPEASSSGSFELLLCVIEDARKPRNEAAAWIIDG